MPKEPATGENVLVGKAEEVVGHVIGNDDLEGEGEEEEEIAHEVRTEYRREHPS